ncbi:MAG: aspartate-semialdehyde dehydrogenase [Immundisolibacterales bacterium]|nr:aspartate-semialdehyde dehydrogenase [Immundisolibacterales bacterium]
MLDVGFVGWRGMVGSVLLERMQAEGDFTGLAPSFYSTSSPGGPGPADLGFDSGRLGDAFDVGALARHDVIVTCQGGDYTHEVHPRLRAAGWNGYWIDAASALRMEPGTVLVLDPVNADVIAGGLARGRRDFCGANCTVSILLMAFAGLFRAGLVEWVTSMTYQAASGAGAAHMRELAAQMAAIGDAAREPLGDPASSALAVDRSVRAALADDGFPRSRFGAPLAASLLPWIDRPIGGGRSREELKGFEEGNKILGNEVPVPVDGLCVRVGSMRCHAHAVTVKLREDRPLDEIESLIGGAHEWVRVVENTPEATLAELTPAAVSGRLDVAVGRIRKLAMGGEFLTAFSVGDQLLWGAAEPLRRMLGILRSHLGEEHPARAEAA